VKTYPIMLDLTDRPVVVVGGGAVGLRKVRSLRNAGARVTLVAPRIDAEADLAGVSVVREAYRPDVLAGVALVFACTDDPELNARIAADARRAGAIVNVVDTPDHCDFFVPAVLADGEVTVAIGTGGTVPAVAAWLRRRLAEALPDRIGSFASAVEQARREVKGKVANAPKRMGVLKRLVADETYQAFLAEGPEAVRRRLRELLEE
jgi:precorrin-2 dehydrogenase/sirohydrochlorin ferrochelatase